MTRARVALVRVRPDHVGDDLARLWELLGLRPPIDAVTLFAVRVSSRPSALGDTTPWQLEAALRWLSVPNPRVVCADHTLPAPLRTPLARAKVPCVDLSRETLPYPPRARLLALPKVFPEGLRVPAALPGQTAFYLPRIRHEARTSIAGAMRLALDALVGALAVDVRPWRHRAEVDALAIGRELHPARIFLLDATTVGSGPQGVLPEDRGLALASLDAVALDAVGASLLGIDPLAVQQLVLAQEEGLGIADPREIALLGDDWAPPRAVDRAKPVTPVPGTWWHRLAARTPLGALTAQAPALRRDLLGWPSRERTAYESWVTRSPWGALSRRYAAETV